MAAHSNRFQNIGTFFDKIFYKFVSPKDERFDLAHGAVETGSGEVQDVRGMDDAAFLKFAQPDLERLEQLRLIKYKAYQGRKKLAIPVCAVLLPAFGYLDYLLLWLQRSSDDGGAGLTFLVASGIYWWVTQPKREYVRAYKEKILPKLARIFGEFIYSVDSKIDMKTLEESKIIPSYDRYKSEDYFKGTYKGVGIEFSEVHLTQKKGSGKNKRTVTKFKGLCVLLEMKNKKFLGHTTLERDKSKLTEWFKEKSTKMKRARMVDPEFEKMFDAYTNDQVEARYLIDPLMIENLKGLYEEYEGKSMAAAWYDRRMLVMITSNHNHFEPSNIKIPATDPASVLNMKREIGQILSMIDRLELYDPAAIEAGRSRLPEDEINSTFDMS